LYLKLLEKGRPEKQRQYLDVIQAQTDQMVQLVEDILNFSRLELNQSRITFMNVDLNAIVRRTISSHQARAAALGLQLVFYPESGLPRLRGEPDQLSQVVSILLDNALNYTSEGEVRIRTGTAPEQGRAFLEVADTGRGIPPADLPHIFDRFFRGEGIGSSTISGSGLGLSIAQEIVKIHKGEITVESTPGKGSTFRVYLPLAEPQ
jgi:two-component system phosphate regulon sensor histidine kinase PhoR